ncbi:hypothetical protein [Stackebrandtia soli]|uniref:hypothetical protein n=1 Tax=Stackebrandtia soli TaxID=1892856 RepID=UPI0039ED329C
MPKHHEHDPADTSTSNSLTNGGGGRHRRITPKQHDSLIGRGQEAVAELWQSVGQRAKRAVEQARSVAGNTRDSILSSTTYTHIADKAVDIERRTKATWKEAKGRPDTVSFLSRKAASFTRQSAQSARAALAETSDTVTVWRGILGLFVLAVLAVTLVGGPLAGTNNDSPASSTLATDTDRSEDRADRSNERPDATEEEADENEDESTTKEEAEKSEKSEEPKKDTPPKPVGGLDKEQMANAVTIVEVAKDLGLDEKGQAIGLATAMQESQMRNLANHYMPSSLDIPNQGTGGDHDSVGIFQQRPSSGWGSIEECMDVEYAATAFFKSLKQIKGWDDMSLTAAAQAVQVSAYPDAYAKWEDLAYKIIDEVNK